MSNTNHEFSGATNTSRTLSIIVGWLLLISAVIIGFIGYANYRAGGVMGAIGQAILITAFVALLSGLGILFTRGSIK